MRSNKRTQWKRLATIALVTLLVGVLAPAPGSADPLDATDPVEMWEARSAEAHQGAAMAVSPDGFTVFIAGGGFGDGTGRDYIITAYEAITGSELWVARYDGPASGTDLVESIVVSPDGGTVFVTGFSEGNGTANDSTTVAYDALTGELLWEQRYHGGEWRDPHTGAWEWGVPTSGPGVAASGDNVWATRLAGDYERSDCSAIMSPPINLTDADSASFAFEQWRHFGDFEGFFFDLYTAGMLLVTTDDGDTLTLIDNPSPPYNMDPSGRLGGTCFDGLPSGGTPGYIGPEGDTPPPPEYSTVSAGLDDFVGQDNVRVVIAFAALGTELKAGWYIDDFAVTVDGTTTVEDFETSDGGFVQVTTRPVRVAGEIASSVSVSPDGSRVFVTGGGGGPTGMDYITIAYEAATGDELWLNRYDGPASDADRATSIAVSPDGERVFVTGDCRVGGTSVADRDYCTIAYNAANGNELWVAHGPADDQDVPTGLEISPDGGTLFVTGWSIGDGTHYTDYATVAYDTATGDELWVARFNGAGDPYPLEEPAGIAVSPDGGVVFVTGYSVVDQYPWRDYATVAYDADTGDELWVATYDGPAGSQDMATAIATSPDGDAVFVTGRSLGNDTGYDYATVVYDAETGDQQWFARYAGAGGGSHDMANAMVVDPLGLRVYVTGESPALGGDQMTTVAYLTTHGLGL